MTDTNLTRATTAKAKKPRKVKRANFGNVRQLASGRWQARYPAEDGLAMTGPVTLETAAGAWQHIAAVSVDRSRGVYHDPRRGERSVA